MQILLIDDEASLRKTFRMALESMGHVVGESPTGTAAMRLLEEGQFDLAFLDLKLGKESGLDLLPRLVKSFPDLGVVMVTAYATVSSAVEAMRLGAFDYLPKPFTPDQIRACIERWITLKNLRQQVSDLQQQIEKTMPEWDLTSEEPSMQGLMDVAFRVAPTDATILLRGESGTGKGVLAKAIHQRSLRKAKPFVTVHCPSLSGELLESELFGHAKGAFTGAIQATEGKVSHAEGGTLFLDEIGDLPTSLQPKLLRFLQDKQYERIGESLTRIGNVRLIAATNRDLEAEVKQGKFREDLFYRLNVIELTLPPLRERRMDILRLAEHLLRFFARQSGKVIEGFSPEATDAISHHSWPGNLRELRNAVERGVILAQSLTIGVRELPPLSRISSSKKIEVGGLCSLEELEEEHIRRILQHHESLDESAAILGVDPSTLYRKRKKYHL